MYLKFNRFDSILILVLLVSLGTFSIASSSKQEDTKRGMIKEADGYYIEMKSTNKSFNAYLLNTQKVPVRTNNITAKAQFFFPDSTDLEIDLKPFNEVAFTCVPPPGYYGCKITFNVMGKSVSANFPSQTTIVLKD